MQNIVAILLSVLIALILLATGIGKALDLSGFVGVIASYDVLPSLLYWPVAIFMPLLEIVLAVWLLTRRFLVQAALVSALMHLAFVAWTSLALLRGLQLSNCGCFGVFLARPLTWSTVIEDVVMLSASLLLALLGHRVARHKALESLQKP